MPVPEHERVLPRGVVVVAPNRFHAEAEAFVERARGFVGSPDFKGRGASAGRGGVLHDAMEERLGDSPPLPGASTARLLMCSSSKIIQHAQ